MRLPRVTKKISPRAKAANGGGFEALVRDYDGVRYSPRGRTIREAIIREATMTFARGRVIGQEILDALGLGHMKRVREITLEISADSEKIPALTLTLNATRGEVEAIADVVKRYRLAEQEGPTRDDQPNSKPRGRA